MQNTSRKKAKEGMKEKPRFVLFFVEQSLQLYIKYILAKALDDYPKTRSLKILFYELSKVDKNANEFYENHADVMDLVEEAYITARYLGKEYSEKSAKRALEMLENFKEVFRKWIV